MVNRHLVCCDCSCWIQFDTLGTLGCTIPWAEMKGGPCVQVQGRYGGGEVGGRSGRLRKMVESLKRMVTGQGLEETSGDTGDREATLEEAEEREKCVGEKTRDNNSTEESEMKKIYVPERQSSQFIHRKGIHLATYWNTKTTNTRG